MISFSNPKPKTWQEFSEWMRGLKIDNIEIDHDYLNDTITVRNKDTRMNQRISRFVLDHMDPELRQETFLQMIANTMKNPQGGITTTGAITQGTYTISSGGGAGFGAVVKSAMQNHGALGSVMSATYVDDPHRDVKSKLFSFDDERRILEVKQTIKALLFDTVPITALDMTRLVVAGGCFASMLNKEPVKDYDIFMLDDIDNREYVKQLSVSAEGNDDVRLGNSNYMNNKQIEQTVFFKKTGVQYITTKYKTREELVKHFDFKHCCVSYDFSKDKLYITREVYDLIKAKKLVQNSDRIPAEWRFEKFKERGWKHEPLDVTL